MEIQYSAAEGDAALLGTLARARCGGIMNQTIDKILYPTLAAGRGDALEGLGIYGANYKIAIIMVMFIQAFRFAYEPFIFTRDKGEGDDHRMRMYSDAMKYFVLFALIIFMGVMFYLDIIKYFISPRYFSGLKVVPVIMAAELFFGIFFNLSVWYKLTDKTTMGSLVLAVRTRHNPVAQHLARAPHGLYGLRMGSLLLLRSHDGGQLLHRTWQISHKL